MSASTIYILGGSQTDFSRNWAREGKSIYDLFSDCLNDAFAQTAIEPADVDVAHVGNFVGDLFAGQALLNGLFAHVHPDLNNIPSSRHEAACASGSMALLAAMRDIEAGHYDLACVHGIELMRNVDGKTAASHLGTAAWQGVETEACVYPWPNMFARILEIYDQRYGVDLSHLRAIASNNFANASRNPYAQTRNWDFNDASFTDSDAANPIIEGRLRKNDCGQVTDGAAVVFLASESYAKKYADRHGLALQDLPRIKGWGHRSSALLLDEKLALNKGSELLFPHVKSTFSDALARANLENVYSLDGLEVHDCFSITEYMIFDHAGLTEPGQSHRAVEDGVFTMQGRLPVNPSGGLIGLGHPVGATGVRMLLDAAKQVSGKAGECQVEGAKNFATFNLGGSTTTCAAFIVGV